MDTHLVEKPFSGAAKKIIQSAGLEEKFQDIAGPP